MKRLTFEIMPPLEDPCPRCEGSGSEWKVRKDGKSDRRYFFPIGPCPACKGTRRRGL